MTRWIAGYLAAMVVFVAGDLAWLSLTGPRLYRPAIGPLLADKPDLRPAIVFYLLYGVGVCAFAIAPGLRVGRPLAALGWGALLGLVAYGVYDLTNQATLKLWSTRLSLLDMAWGAAITGVAALAGCIAAGALDKP
jgi:uncharacterized membrane protein